MFQNLRAAASTRQDLQGDLPSVEDKEESCTTKDWRNHTLTDC